MRYLSLEPTASSAACRRRDKLAAAAKATVPPVTLRRADRRDKVFFMAASLHPRQQRVQLKNRQDFLMSAREWEPRQLASLEPLTWPELSWENVIRCCLKHFEPNSIA